MHIAPYITEQEYRCRCCGEYPPNFRVENPIPSRQILFEAFKNIREAWGKPIIINSGYRCPTHNSMVGGSYLSAHMFGLALDLKSSEDEVAELADTIEDIAPELRRREYENSIHIDVAYYIRPQASHAWVEGKRWVR